MNAMKIIKSTIISFTIVLLLGGCETLETMSTGSPRTITLDGTSYSEEEYGSFESWACKDYIYGGKMLFEVGRFEDPNLSQYGFILYDGKSSGDLTSFERRGVNLRWDWATTSGSYAFILKPDGVGSFYDFSNTDEDGMTKPTDVYKCSKR